MSKIEYRFKELKEKGKKALIIFITAGDPNLEATKDIIREMEKRGADIIELGIPYSDPIAEGPVIQKANARALKNDVRIINIMKMVSEIKKEVKTPIVFLLYFNCIYKYGMEKFFEDCTHYGVDGLIIPDLPLEERDEIDETASKYPVDIITLVAPTSKDRIERIVKNARGFLYCVSSLGVTGMRNDFATDFDEFFSYIDRFTSIPKAIGFGISTVEHVNKLKGYCDGLIIGSAVVKQIENSSNAQEAAKNAGNFVQMLREALDSK